MSVKTSDYWVAVQTIANEVQRISIEVQGPLIEEHFTPDQIAEMEPAEVTRALEPYYTDEDLAKWASLELQTFALMKEYTLDREDVANDVWNALISLRTTEVAH